LAINIEIGAESYLQTNKNQLLNWATINHEDPLCVFENEKKDVIIKTKEFKYLF
jgi:hypothetical protein